jgi:hypothetical protein
MTLRNAAVVPSASVAGAGRGVGLLMGMADYRLEGSGLTGGFGEQRVGE